jgi:polysaccharide biosynthesis/export protein
MTRNNVGSSLLILLLFWTVVLLNGCASDVIKPNDETIGQDPNSIRISEFILGHGDKIDVTVYRHDELKRTVQVDMSGKIMFPLVGDIQAAGLSVFQLRDRMRERLAEYIIDPQISLYVNAVLSQKVVVLGEVNKPGLFALDNPLKALDAVALAGGFTLDAKQQNVLLIRGGLEKPQLITLNMNKLFDDHDMTQNVALRNGDVIYVPATYIANISRYFEHLSKIIAPVLQLESGYYIGQQIEKAGQGAATVPVK